MIIVIGIIVLLVLAGAFLLATARQRSKTDTGKLSRSTRRADSSQPPEGFVDDASSKVVAVKDEDDASVPMVSEDKSPVRYEPVDEEELGVTRRQFFNRGILTGLALGVGGFGAAAPSHRVRLTACWLTRGVARLRSPGIVTPQPAPPPRTLG